MEKRVVALDVGEKRIGVAVSDLLGLTAQGVETIFTKGQERDLLRVREILKQYDTDTLIIGLPKSMDGTVGFQAERVKTYVQPLAEEGYTLIYQDERMTTISAHRTLLEADVSRQKRKQVVDKLAATYILQAFLDSGGLKRLKKESSEKKEKREVYRLMDGYMERENIVELVDEEGNPVKFEHITTVQYKGGEYVLLVPVEPTEDLDEDELIILKIESTDEGDAYVGVEDEDLLEAVYEKYLEEAEADEE